MAESADQIAEWKLKYGEIYSAPHKASEYIFRALTFAEHNEIGKATDSSSADSENVIVFTALLSPDLESVDAVDKIPAGFVTVLAEKIQDVSGYGDPDHVKAVLESMRDRASQVLGLMKAFVLAAMPAYTEEDLEAMNFTDLAGKVALAEQIIQVKQAAFPLITGDVRVKLDIIDPEDEEIEVQSELHKHAAQKKPGTAGLNDPIAQKLHNALR